MLSELFISVNYGEIVSVLGKSGVGKSTLLRTIMHDLPRQAHRSKGRILVDNQDIDVLARDTPGISWGSSVYGVSKSEPNIFSVAHNRSTC